MNLPPGPAVGLPPGRQVGPAVLAHPWATTVFWREVEVGGLLHLCSYSFCKCYKQQEGKSVQFSPSGSAPPQSEKCQTFCKPWKTQCCTTGGITLLGNQLFTHHPRASHLILWKEQMWGDFPGKSCCSISSGLPSWGLPDSRPSGGVKLRKWAPFPSFILKKCFLMEWSNVWIYYYERKWKC